MNSHSQFYARSVGDPTSLKKTEVIGRFSIFIDKVAASSKLDQGNAELQEASTNLELALQSYIGVKVHANYQPACYRLLANKLSNIVAYCNAMAANCEGHPQSVDSNPQEITANLADIAEATNFRSRKFTHKQLDTVISIMIGGLSVNELPSPEREQFISAMTEIRSSNLSEDEKCQRISQEISKAALIVKNTKRNAYLPSNLEG